MTDGIEAVRKVYRSLRGAPDDNVWSPDGRWFVTTVHFRGPWRLRHRWKSGGYAGIADGASWGWGVWLSGWRTWFVPLFQVAYTHETEPPYRSGRGVAIWLWGRVSVVVGRWAPSGYDPTEELEELWDRGTAEYEEDDFDPRELYKYRLH